MLALLILLAHFVAHTTTAAWLLRWPLLALGLLTAGGIYADHLTSSRKDNVS